MPCMGLCHRYRAKKGRANQAMYVRGGLTKRCTTCETFILWDGLFCPCCGIRVRISPRRAVEKRRYVEAHFGRIGGSGGGGDK